MLNSKTLSAILVAAILCHHGSAKTVPSKRHTRDADLSRAIEILQAQRDRLHEEDFRRLAESGIDLQALGLLDDDEVADEDPLWLAEPLQDQEQPGDLIENQDIITDDDLVPIERDIVETSKEELNNIFDNSDPETKIGKTEKIIEENTASDNGGTDDDSLSDDEYQALLRAVQKLQKHSAGKLQDAEVEVLEMKRAPKDLVKLSKEELREVFNDNSDKMALESPGVLKRSPQIDSNKIEETLPLDDYWLLNNYLNYDDSRKKRFTQQQGPVKEEPGQDRIDEDKAQMFLELQRLGSVAKWQDLEIEALTEALNRATQSQREGSVAPQEFKALEKAIEIEETLQSLNPTDDDQLALIVQEIARETLKRGEPEFKRMDSNTLEDVYPMYNDVAKAKKRAPYQDNKGVWYDFAMQDKRTSLPPKELLEYLESQLADNSNDSQQEEDENAISSILSDENQEETALTPYISENQQEECPEVDTFSDGCAFADYYGLPIDKEARELCNRYQICYTCGASFGLTSRWCDDTYREIYSNLCEENSECVIEAELFLRTMKLKRRFIKQQICLHRCTAEYIGIA